jgi:hypothetical protein
MEHNVIRMAVTIQHLENVGYKIKFKLNHLQAELYLEESLNMFVCSGHGKVNLPLFLSTTPWRCIAGVTVKLHAFLTPALDGVSG